MDFRKALENCSFQNTRKHIGNKLDKIDSSLQTEVPGRTDTTESEQV